MKKLAALAVDKHRVFLAVMILIAAVCAALIPQVGINSDMTKYLPDDSSMKMGMDLMEAEIPAASADSSIRVMFKGLTADEKAEVREALRGIEYVSAVAYDAQGADFNSGDYSLFVVSTEYEYGSNEETSVEAAIEENFSEYEMTYRNDNVGKKTIPPLLIVIALASLMLILVIMCPSWTEPVLFVITIGLAVAINLGTNIFMGSISDITFSIAAILQLVLSMDYSIILMSRFRQELRHTDDKSAAMKIALKNAFSSISSSAMTTIVGLLALLFMNFKIGLDLGIVLAKGVFISMVCVFTVLPGLILIFHGAIEKSPKKQPHFSMRRCAHFTNRARHFLAAGFVIILIGAYFLQSMTQISYFMEDEDTIADIFPSSNDIVLLYKNSDDAAVTALAERLEGEEFIDEAVSYSTTLGRQYSSVRLAHELNTLGGDLALDSSLLNVLYYDYHTNGHRPAVAPGDLLSFISEQIDAGGAITEYMDTDLLDEAAQLKNFSDRDKLIYPSPAENIAQLLGLREAEVQQIMLYYFSENGGVTAQPMTMPEFIAFTQALAQNPEYAQAVDAEMLGATGQLTPFTDAAAMTAPLSSAQMAQVLGLDEQTVTLLFAYCNGFDDSYTPAAMTLPEFSQFLNGVILPSPQFSATLDDTTRATAAQLATFTDSQAINAPLSAEELAAALSMPAQQVSQLMAMGGAPGGSMSIYRFVTLVNTAAADPTLAAALGEEGIAQFAMLKNLMDAAMSGIAFDYEAMAQMLGMHAPQLKQLYCLREGFYTDTSAWRMTVQDTLNALTLNPDAFSAMIDPATAAQLNTAALVVNASVAGGSITSEEMASILLAPESDIRALYLLREFENGGGAEWRLSPQRLIQFMDTSSAISGQMQAAEANELRRARTIIDAVVSENPLSYSQTAALLGIDEDTAELMHLYYAGSTLLGDGVTMSLAQFVDYLDTALAADSAMSELVDPDMRAQAADAKEQTDEAAEMLRGDDYSLLMLSTSLPVEAAETSDFVGSLIDTCDAQLSGEHYLIGSSVMNYEMENSFDEEMLLITLLTAIAIFIVVALTFRSLVIPAILVLIVQCGVYLTICVIGLQGYSIYYLALLMVQCILMGATIDYGILFTNYYREYRADMDVGDSIAAAYDGSMHTIMTSGLILIIVTAILGFSSIDKTIGEICSTISIGALCVTLLIIFVLPGLLAAFDKFVVRKKPKEKIEQ